MITSTKPNSEYLTRSMVNTPTGFLNIRVGGVAASAAPFFDKRYAAAFSPKLRCT